MSRYSAVGSQSRRRRARYNFMSMLFHLRSTPCKFGFILLQGEMLSLVHARSWSVIFTEVFWPTGTPESEIGSTAGRELNTVRIESGVGPLEPSPLRCGHRQST
jgi:hypothetical protein